MGVNGIVLLYYLVQVIRASAVKIFNLYFK